MNDPTSSCRLGYYAAVAEENEAADDALAAIRAEEAEQHITPRQAAAERAALLRQHLDRLARLRATYLGGEGTTP
jgi:hypothetical protein